MSSDIEGLPSIDTARILSNRIIRRINILNVAWLLTERHKFYYSFIIYVLIIVKRAFRPVGRYLEQSLINI